MLRRLATFLVLVPVLWAAEPVIDSERLAQIPERMQAFIDQGRTAGVVTLVKHRGQIVSLKALGYQNLETKKPMATDSIFQIMSMTKPVTGAAVLMLYEEGRVRLMDPVEQYLPEFRYQMLRSGSRGDGSVTLVKPARPITVRDLMTHTSGMGGNYLPEFRQRLYAEGLTLADGVREAARLPLEFEPGTRWQYSNTGLATLGRIVEVVSGMKYEEFLQARIFEPLGMKDTFFFPPASKRDRIAKVYDFQDDKISVSSADLYREGRKYASPSGGLFSTAEDMALFYQMLLDGGSLDGNRFLSPSTIELMTRVHTAGIENDGHRPGTGYGLTVEVVDDPAGMAQLGSMGTFGHGGAFMTQGWIDPNLDLIHVFMMQRRQDWSRDEHYSFRAIATAAVQEE